MTSSKIIVSLITLLTGMLLSRFRTLEEYGTYSQITLVINLFTTIFMLGLPNSLNYFLAKADTNLERKDFLSVYYTLSTILSLLVGAILVVSTPLLISYFNNPLLSVFWYYLAFFPITKIIGSSIENIFVVYRKANYIIFFRAANSLAVLGAILLVQIMDWSFNTYMKLYLGVELLVSVMVYLTAYRLANGLKVRIDLTYIKKIFAFSIPIGLASMIGTLNIEIDKLMLGNLLDTEQLAIYTNASREMPFTMIATSITAVLLPKMVLLLKKNEMESAIKLWGNAIKISFTILAFCTFVLFFFAPEVMTILYSEKYLQGVPIFRIYSLVLLCRFTYVGMVLNASGKTKMIFYSSVVSFGMNAILNYVLFHVWGWIGPAIATLFSLIIMGAFQIWYSGKVIHVTFRKIFPWGCMMIILLRQGALGIAMYLLKNISHIDVYIADIYHVSLPMASACEAMGIGVLWIVLFAVIEIKPMKKSWKSLNYGENEKAVMQE